jgi:hypothetical protein
MPFGLGSSEPNPLMLASCSKDRATGDHNLGRTCTRQNTILVWALILSLRMGAKTDFSLTRGLAMLLPKIPLCFCFYSPFVIPLDICLLGLSTRRR